jgi:hypothetical protein
VHRAILDACGPCALALLGSGCLLVALLQISGAKWDWSRLTQIHRCESGAVQSLSFVVTFPLLLAILMLIVQVSQLMIAQMFVHYAAFAGARSASVWLSAWVTDPPGGQVSQAERDCEANPLQCPDQPLEAPNLLSVTPQATGNNGQLIEVVANSPSGKLRKIRAAAIQACAPIAPSRSVGAQPQSNDIPNIYNESAAIYTSLVPSSQSNPLIPRRLANKLAYTDANTQVFVEWNDAKSGAGSDSLSYRTYNPQNHPIAVYRPNEAGWQDPVTVYVVHRFALLPGPGRLLAKQIVRADGLPDRVSSRIQQNPTATSERLYSTIIQASATMTNEGIKSVRPYVQP